MVGYIQLSRATKKDGSGRLFVDAKGCAVGFILEEDIKKIKELRIYKKRKFAGGVVYNGIEGDFPEQQEDPRWGFIFKRIFIKERMKFGSVIKETETDKIRGIVYRNSIPGFHKDGFVYTRNNLYFKYLGKECPKSIRSGLNVFGILPNAKICNIRKNVNGRSVMSAIKTFAAPSYEKDWENAVTEQQVGDFPDSIRYFNATFENQYIYLECPYDSWLKSGEYGQNSPEVKKIPERFWADFKGERYRFLWVFSVTHAGVFKNVFKNAVFRNVRVVVPNPGTNKDFQKELEETDPEWEIWTPSRMDQFLTWEKGEGIEVVE